MKTILEICCGSAEDVLIAKRAGADRVELNSALFMGGLTPTLATLDLIKRHTDIPVISMIRCRGAGFCYNELEFEVMLSDAKALLDHGTDGLAFGALTPDHEIDLDKTRAMVELAHAYGKELVIHRAFDCVHDPFKSIHELIDLKVDRILTSGKSATALEGKATLKQLQDRYGNQIELLMGGKVNQDNVLGLIEETGITQVHSSCKTWLLDPTTRNENVSYAYGPLPSHYEAVDQKLAEDLVNTLRQVKK